METDLAKKIDRSKAKEQYDQQCKAVLSNKYVLAYILKYTAHEVEGLSIQEIMNCIEGSPVVGKEKVLESNDAIHGNNTEDSSTTEGVLYYDIRFFIYTEEEKKKILFDVEAQKKFNPGYKIVTRGIVYSARMISSQINREFDLKHYDNVKKVYSVWICFNSPAYIGNAISRYFIKKEDILTGIPDEKEAYDKIEVIQICLKEDEESAHVLIRLLNLIFSRKKKSEDVKRLLESEFGIPMDDGYGKEIEEMCNLSDVVEERGIEKGIAQGIEKGIAQGIEKGIAIGEAQGMVKVYKKIGLSAEQIANEMQIPIKDVVEILKKVS